MLVEVVGCSHHGTSIALRERLAFSREQLREALDHWRRVFPGVEAVLLPVSHPFECWGDGRARDDRMGKPVNPEQERRKDEPSARRG